jgi:hypothetical protein
VDVDEYGSGALRDGRRYEFVREQDAGRERTFLESGAAASAVALG